MENYILLYGDKKPEDNICIKNMFKNNKQIKLGWTDFDYNENMKVINDSMKEEIEQIIISGLHKTVFYIMIMRGRTFSNY